jgi:MSHA biogenesis protein MshO
MRHGSNASPETGARGFTLVEMMVVMAVTGIVAATTAVFLKLPLQAYQDTERRAALTDMLDTTFTYLRRDLQTALPNSVRVTSVGAVYYLEFLKTRTAGRYRADNPNPVGAWTANACPDGDGDARENENALAFGVADTCFVTSGDLPNRTSIAAGSDFVVVYNLGPGYGSADAYSSGAATGGNKSLVTSVAAGTGGRNVLQFQSNTFNLESPARRFYVVSGPVTYVCDPAAGTLRRVSGYAIAAAQATPPAGTAVLLGQGLTGCTMTYDQNVANQRIGLVSLWLQAADPGGGTTVRLFQQVQVSNVP